MELSFFTSENERRKSRCCFTGHRPEKLDCSEQEAIALLQKNIRYAYDLGYTTFITGMSRGVDIWAAEIVLEEKRRHPDICLFCAIPHPDFEKRWNAEWQQRYRAIQMAADFRQTICPSFSKGCYLSSYRLTRNRPTSSRCRHRLSFRLSGTLGFSMRLTSKLRSCR